MKEKSKLQYISLATKKHYEDLVNIGENVIFPPEKHYTVGNLANNFDFFMRKNLQRISIFAASSVPAEVSGLKSLVLKSSAKIKASQIFSQDRVNYNILKYFYKIKSDDLPREGGSVSISE